MESTQHEAHSSDRPHPNFIPGTRPQRLSEDLPSLLTACITKIDRDISDLDPEQLACIGEVKTWFKDHWQNLNKHKIHTRNRLGPVGSQELEGLARSFLKLFFMGDMEKFKVKWIERSTWISTGIGGATEVHQSCTSIEMIEVFKRELLNPDVPDLATVYISTLLHELVHAFLLTYGCRGDGSGHYGCTYELCAEREAYSARGLGHGEDFQLLVAVVERKANEWFGLALDSGREDDAMGEVKERKIPFATDLMAKVFPGSECKWNAFPSIRSDIPEAAARATE